MVKEEKTLSLANGHMFVQIILLMPSEQLQTWTLFFFLQFQTKKNYSLKKKKVECKLIMQDSKHAKLVVKENTLSEDKIFSPWKTFANVTRDWCSFLYSWFYKYWNFSIIVQIFEPQSFYYAILEWGKENFKIE